VSLDLIIFSKDRACQLDFLLRSVKQEFTDWRTARLVVLYTYSSSALRYSYDLVRAEHPEVEFVCERDVDLNFKQATLRLLGHNPLVAFLVDDDVFKQPFALAAPELAVFEADPQIMCVSLRMDPAMDYVYTLDRPAARPDFHDGNIWDWTVSDGDWNYPMSLDGHIFRTAELVPLFERVAFHNPNSLEFELSKQPLANPRMVCFDIARIINLPLNRVQDTAPNHHLGLDEHMLNARFVKGERPALVTVAGVRSRSPHHELELQWEPWRGAPRWVGPMAELDARSAALLRRSADARRLPRRAAAAAARRLRNRSKQP
jgi:hypothetical protein